MGVDHRLKLAYLHGGVVQYRPGETLGPRVLPDYEMVLILEGSVTYQANERSYAAPPGSLILAQPGFQESYRWDPLGPTRHAFFHFQIEQAPDAWPTASTWPVARTQPDPVLPALFRHVLHRFQVHQDWPAQPPGWEDCRVVETLLSIFLEERGSGAADFQRDRPPPVSRAMHAMRQALEQEQHHTLCLDKLAKTAGINEKHLCRLFRKAIGYSPMETYRLLCLQFSVVLLARSNLTIQQIAHRCGFDDPAYFSRSFSKTFGCSPREVRRRLSAGLLPPASPLPVDLTPRISW